MQNNNNLTSPKGKKAKGGRQKNGGGGAFRFNTWLHLVLLMSDVACRLGK